jgi:hypothetical protein
VVTEIIDSFFVDLTDRQYGALLAGLTLLFGYLQIVIEDRTGKALLRQPSPPARPVDVVEEAPRGGYASGVKPHLKDPDADPEYPRLEGGAFDTSILIAVAAVVVIVAGLIYIAQAL